jgi:signal transduction histidine kinase
LAISKQFCEMMGGTIKVSSEAGKGTTFTVCIPAVIEMENNSPELTETAA